LEAPLADLSIVIVTWHSAADLPPLLASLASVLAAGAELVVVENASGDAAPAIIRALAPGATVIVNGENRGFAAAANQGLVASRGAFVLFLNPDTVAEPGTVPRALAAIAAEPTIGIVGCRTVNEDGTPQPTVDRFHTVGGLVAHALAAGRFLGTRPRGYVPEATGDVDWVHGSFLLGRREVLEAVGGFDEGYEMYGEDLDLCHRVRARGSRVVYVAEATIMHRGNRSGALRYGAGRDVAALRGTLRFFRRRRGAAAERVFRLLAGTSFVVKALANGIGGLCGAGRAARSRGRLYARMAWLCARGDTGAAGERVQPALGPGRLRPRPSPGIEGP
jgi:GT2 family glycosyltransferase